jgi:hypothetical protein
MMTAIVFRVRVLTTGDSAYSACRKMAMHVKGYATWKYKNTIQEKASAWVIFSDGSNDLSCRVIAIGPFWAVTDSMRTLVGCVKSFGLPPISCPEGFFGVSP